MSLACCEWARPAPQGCGSLRPGRDTSSACRQVVTARVDARAAGELLAEHLGGNLVKIGRAWHTQTRGIPQAC